MSMTMSAKATYEVLTWDMDLQKWTPQIGVRRGPYRLWALRKALRQLQHMGYEVRRGNAPSVLIERRVCP